MGGQAGAGKESSAGRERSVVERTGGVPAEGARVTIEIVEIQGTGACSIGHRVGDRWEVDSALVPAGICGWAYAAMLPFLQPLRFGGSFPWEEAGEAVVCCPDPHNPVVFRLSVSR